MRLFFILLFLLWSMASPAQKNTKKCPPVQKQLQQIFHNSIVPIDPDYAKESYEDLAFLKTIIGDKRVVLLGESDHFVEEYSQIKNRLIRFLHQEMDFEVLLFESDFFNCTTSYRICDSLSTKAFLENSIFPLWYTKINYTLFQYIQTAKSTKKPLILSGFDLKKSNSTDNQLLYAHYKKHLSPVDYAEFVALDTTTNTYFKAAILQKNKQPFNSSLSLDLTKRYKRLLNKLDAYATNLDITLLKRIIHNKQYQLEIIEKALGNAYLYMNLRDKFMAENVEWIATYLYPDKKIIIWAANLHIKNNNIPNIKSTGLLTMGSHLSEKMEKQLYRVGLFGLEGSIGQMNQRFEVNNIKRNSIEALVCQKNNLVSFVDLTPQRFLHSHKKLCLRRQRKTVYQVAKEYDGLLFIQKTTPPIFVP